VDLIYFLGRFHVLALHLPIGIIVSAVVIECLLYSKKYRHLESATRFVWGAAALTAIGTVILGMMHFSEGGFDGVSGSAHRLYGMSVAFVATLIWIFRLNILTGFHKVRTLSSFILLFLVVMTGHYGGNLTHGSTYLVKYAPAPIRNMVGLDPVRPAVTELANADPFYDVVQPMLRARCSSCHGDAKRKGQLNLMGLQSIYIGGETGPAIVSGDAAQSNLYRHITLPPEHEDFMPAEGKTPLTDRQVDIIAWWIDAGTPIDMTLANVEFDEQTRIQLMAELGLGGNTVYEENVTLAVAVEADPILVASLFDAGFLVRQVSLSEPLLTVNVFAPGDPVSDAQLGSVQMAAGEIVDLDLRSSNIGDLSFSSLGHFPQLKRLQLSNNVLTDAVMQDISALVNLEYLNLYGNIAITDASIDALAGMENIKNLYLWGTGVSESGISRLSLLRPDLQIDAGQSAAFDID
jgi:uncharacterized membrane protein